jgi:hypothetical protein
MLENWNGTPARWIKADASIIIDSKEDCAVDLSLPMLSFYRPRTLEIYSGDGLAARVAVPISCFITANVRLRLEKGENTIRLHVPEGCERPSDKHELNNRDLGCLSLAIETIKLHELEL